MKTKKSQEDLLSGIKFPLPMKIVSYFMRKCLATPYEIAIDYLKRDEEPKMTTAEIAAKIAKHHCHYSIAVWYRLHQAYVHDFQEQLSRYELIFNEPHAHTMIEQSVKPMSDFVFIMKAQLEPVYCIDDLALTQMCFLIQARVDTILYAKHWKKIPGGEEKRKKADIFFDELCANSRLPRFTRATVHKKKEKELKEIEEFNNSFRQEKTQSENDSESN